MFLHINVFKMVMISYKDLKSGKLVSVNYVIRMPSQVPRRNIQFPGSLQDRAPRLSGL
jgi:hypothetical protein